MNARQTIAAIRAALNQVQDSGQKFVSVEAMLEYLANLDGSVPVESEVRKLEHESNLAQHRAIHESDLEMFRSVIEAGRTALSSCILINGGATVALLAYLGNLLAKNPTVVAPRPLVYALVGFAVAVLCATVASGVRYLSQASFSKSWQQAGHVCNIISILLVVAAYFLFALGVFNAYVAFK